MHSGSIAGRPLSLAKRKVDDEARTRVNPNAMMRSRSKKEKQDEEQGMTRCSNKYIPLPTEYRKLQAQQEIEEKRPKRRKEIQHFFGLLCFRFWCRANRFFLRFKIFWFLWVFKRKGEILPKEEIHTETKKGRTSRFFEIQFFFGFCGFSKKKRGNLAKGRNPYRTEVVQKKKT